ncbi:MAG: spore coat protein [Oscillospiraceae bacterium]|jgi:spore coat protein CotF|nr:spore coat protein [Oscillospiraceae bacterium]
MNNMQQGLSDQEIMEDILSSQKLITGIYNTFSNECVHQPLRDDFLNILREEHNLQSCVFTEMEKRGWYNPPPAEAQMVNQTKTKFTNIGQSL